MGRRRRRMWKYSREGKHGSPTLNVGWVLVGRSRETCGAWCGHGGLLFFYHARVSVLAEENTHIPHRPYQLSSALSNSQPSRARFRPSAFGRC